SRARHPDQRRPPLRRLGGGRRHMSDAQAGTVIVVARDAMDAARVEAALHDLAGWRIEVCRPRQLAGRLDEHPEAIVALVLAAAAPAGAPLTSREREILELMADGANNRIIAARLAISRHTVKFHVASILAKLGATSRTEAVALALRGGLLAV